VRKDCWFDSLLPFRTRAGKLVEASPLDITRDHDEDPIIGVVARHAYVEIGFRFIMRDMLQVALAPLDGDAWAKLVAYPPSPNELRKALEPYRAAFVLSDDRFPAMQVRPSPERLAEIAQEGSTEPDERSDKEDDSRRLPISALLPDAPTGNVVDSDRDFFVKRDTVQAIGAGAIVPVLYSHMVLFPPAGGGYFTLPHGIDSLKFAIIGDTLWRSISANLMDRSQGEMAEAQWPAPCDASVFPWLDPSLRELSLKRNRPDARRLVRRSSLHPAFIPLPRRYKLGEPCERCCDLTGLVGPSFTSYERWPKGLQYDARDWRPPFAAIIEQLEWAGETWVPRRAKPKARSEPDESTAAADEPDLAGPIFLKSRGSLRFDQWLELSIGDPPPPPRTPGKEKKWYRVLRPLVVSAFMAREPALTDELGLTHQQSALARRTGFRLEAMAAVLDGKTLGGFERRSLALWWADDRVSATISGAVRGLLEACHHVAMALKSAANEAVGTGGTGVLPRQLQDSVFATLDAELANASQAMFAEFAGADTADAAHEAVNAQRARVVRVVAANALELFDANFSFATIDRTAVRIAAARGKLKGALAKSIAAETPKTPEGKVVA
jgi:hypothetical protein